MPVKCTSPDWVKCGLLNRLTFGMFMMRQLLMVVCLFLTAIVGWVGAVEPNYVQKTIYDVDGIITVMEVPKENSSSSIKVKSL